MKNFLCLFLCLVFLTPALAAAPPAAPAAKAGVPAAAPQSPPVPPVFDAKNMVLAETGVVKDILKSDMVLMENDKRYRLEGIRVPVDYDQDALDALANLVLKKKINIYVPRAGEGELPVDRYGVVLAQAVLEEGAVWVQGEMVSRGHAWAFSMAGDPAIMTPLKEREGAARASFSGFWGNPLYAIRSPETVGQYINSFQVVEGRILNVAVKKRTAFINFGQDWKTDFTIEFSRNHWDKFSSAYDFTPEVWRGKKVRIRGWVEDRNGPMIDLADATQIDFFKE